MQTDREEIKKNIQTSDEPHNIITDSPNHIWALYLEIGKFDKIELSVAITKLKELAESLNYL